MTTPTASNTPPPDTRPPSKPPKDNRPPTKPPKKSAAGVLLALDDVLATALDTARRIPAGVSGCDVVSEELIQHHIRMARRLLRRRAGVPISGREGKVAVPAVSSRPVRLRAGGPPVPGAGIDLMEALKASLNRRAD